MVVDGSGFDGRGDAGPFCQQVIRECSARGFDGVILDFEGSPHPLLGQIANRLGTALSRRSWPLYVTEEYAGFSDQARIIIPSALSGGSLSPAPDRSGGAVRRGAGGAGRTAYRGGFYPSRPQRQRHSAQPSGAVPAHRVPGRGHLLFR